MGMIRTFLTGLSLIIKVCMAAAVSKSQVGEGELLKTLLANYSRLIRPVVNHGDAVKVNITLDYHHLLQLDDKHEVLSSIVWIGTTWVDEFLTWDEGLTGIQRLVLPADTVWRPDLYVLNLAEESKSLIVPLLGYMETAMFYPNGTVIHYMPLKLDTSCKLHLVKFPFDTQTCFIQIGSWAYDFKELQLTLHEDPNVTEFHDHMASSEWTILSLTGGYKDMVYELFSSTVAQREVVFRLQVQRRASSHMLYTILPCLMLDITVIVSFLLPLRSGERVGVCLTTFLAYSVQLLIVAGDLPDSMDIPDLAVSFLYFMGMAMVAIIWSVIGRRIQLQGQAYGSPPHCLLRLAQSLDFCTASNRSTNMIDSASENIKAEDQDEQKEDPTGNGSGSSHNESSTIKHTPSSSESEAVSICGGIANANRVDHLDDWCLIVLAIDKVLFVLYFFQLSLASLYYVMI